MTERVKSSRVILIHQLLIANYYCAHTVTTSELRAFWMESSAVTERGSIKQQLSGEYFGIKAKHFFFSRTSENIPRRSNVGVTSW